MGGKLSCPSEILDPVWIKDDSVTHCTNCGGGAGFSGNAAGLGAAAAAAAAIDNTRGSGGAAGSFSARSNSAAAAAGGGGAGPAEQGKFGLTNRRHHCRSCGIVCCKNCWGQIVQLEQIYGFPGPVPICSVCADILTPEGSMNLLRRGVTVAFTHEPRSNVTAESQTAPLATSNIKARRFTTNQLRLHKWRPFTRRTMLLLAKTKSSRDVLRTRSGLTPRTRSNSARGSDGAFGGNPDPRDSTTSQGGASAGDWTVDLDAVESIQLMNVAEKDGGDFILISTDFEEHRLQAIKMRFEEMATLNNPAALDALETSSRAVSEATSLSPDGGDRDNASDRRSAVSAGTRLRTVMLDREGTIELYNALRRAHATCRRRAMSMPPEIRTYIDIDAPAEDVVPGAEGGFVTPRSSQINGAAPSAPVPIPAGASQSGLGGAAGGASPSRSPGRGSIGKGLPPMAPATGARQSIHSG